MIELKADNADSLYAQWREMLMVSPEVEVRRLKTKELVDTVSVLTNPYECILSGQDERYYRYALKELFFYLQGSLKAADAVKLSKFWDMVKENDKINSNYGHHVFYKYCPSAHNQFMWAVNELKKDPMSRKAVMNINSIEHKNGIEKDFPCTIAYQFLIRGNKLSIRSYMRSNDLVYGWRYDILWECFLLIMVWIHVREKFPLLDVGEVVHHATSLHLYEKDWVK